MFFYFFMTTSIILIFTILHLSNLKYNKLISLIISSCILIAVSGLRGFSVGSDTNSYINLFKLASSSFYNFSFESYYEPGYLLYNYTIGQLTSNAQIFLLITSAIIIFSIGQFIYRNSKSYFISIYLFITLMYFYSSMNVTRQFLAVSIILLSFKFVKEKKLIKYIIGVLVASLFHTSALISILIYYVYNLKFSFRRVIIIFSLMLIGFTLLAPLLELSMNFFSRYDNYVLTRLGDNNLASLLKSLMYLSILILGLYVIKNRNQNEKLMNEYKEGLSLSEKTFKPDFQGLTYIILVAVCISFLSIELNILNRAALYFTVFMIIYIPNLISLILNKNIRFLILITILILITLYNVIIFMYRPEWHSVIPYQFNM